MLKSLHRKLLGYFAVVVIIMAAVGFTTWWQDSELASVAADIYQKNDLSIDQARQALADSETKNREPTARPLDRLFTLFASGPNTVPGEIGKAFSRVVEQLERDNSAYQARTTELI